MAQQVDRNAGREIEIFLALLAIEIDPLAPYRPLGRTRVNGHKRRNGHDGSFLGGVKDYGVPRGPHWRAYSFEANQTKGAGHKRYFDVAKLNHDENCSECF